MSMTITMNETGNVALSESVLAMFGITGAKQIELDVEDDGVKLRLVDSTKPATENVPVARIEYRDGFPVIVGTLRLTNAEVVRAIKAGRDERSDKLVSRHRKKA